MINSKYFILCLAVCIISSCTNYMDRGDNPNRKTNSGYVAFDYTCTSIRRYTPLFKQLYVFNEYYKQPDAAKRDSVDRLYFRDAKIVHKENGSWTIRSMGYMFYSDYTVLSINTNGKSLNEEGAVWEVSDYDEYYNAWKTIEFKIENTGDDNWSVSKHDNKNCGEFDYTTEWNIRFKDNAESYSVEGSGTLLSIASPKLQLDYTITEPIEVNEENNWNNDVNSGKIKIIAKNVNENRIEQIDVNILSNSIIEVTFEKCTEEWDYKIFW